MELISEETPDPIYTIKVTKSELSDIHKALGGVAFGYETYRAIGRILYGE